MNANSRRGRVRPATYLTACAGALALIAGVAVAARANAAADAKPTTEAKPAPGAKPAASPTMADVLKAAKPSDWRTLDPAYTLYLELASGRVIIELAPEFAPLHVENIRRLVRERYFDGLAIVRSQDNYVVQWGDPEGTKSSAAATAKFAPEFSRPAAGLAFTKLPDGDVYAPEVGFSGGFPVARDPASGQAWLTHCYAMLGVGRDLAADSGSGAELYVVNGHAPRHLDLNVALVGRVVQGIEKLTTLPRGTLPLGFYEDAAQRTPIRSVRLAVDLPPAERVPLEALRTDTATFAALIESRRNRHDEWYIHPAGKIEVCNVPLPVREKPATP